MRRILTFLIGLILLAAVLATAIPELRIDTWWVRFMDFPRLQVTAVLAAALLLYVLVRRSGLGWGTLLTVAGVAALISQVATLWAYQPLAGKMVPDVLRCEEDDRLRILVTNVQQSNRHAEAVIEMARAEAPDVFVVMETSEWWDEALTPLQDDFAVAEQAVQRAPEYYGMQVYSQIPFTEAEMVYPMNSDTPMFEGTLDHPSGPVHLIGLHPRPPHQTNGGQPSTMRDATVLDAAMRARDTEAVTVIAGDFNATPWNDTARRAMRIGQLLDPRQGRGPMNSYKATSDWMRWPLDQVLWQPGPGLLDMAILPPVGSDHHPVRVDLCLSPDVPAEPLPLKDGDLEVARKAAEDARALQAREG